MVTLSNDMTRHVIRELLTDGGNHRLAVFQAINRTFIRYSLDFLQKATESKSQWVDSDIAEIAESDWYVEFLRSQFTDMDEAEIIGAIPKKTIENIYSGKRKALVRSALEANIEHLIEAFEEARALHGPSEVATVTVDGIEFTAAQSMLLMNSLAVKRQQINGGFWSAVGNAVEVPLLKSLCRLYEIDEQYHRGGLKKDNRHQVDYMLRRSGVEYRCEVKLNGRGNPESVTAAIARDPRIVLADHISEQNREKLNSADISWVDFSDNGGFFRFGIALEKFNIPHREAPDLSNLDNILDRILPLP